MLSGIGKILIKLIDDKLNKEAPSVQAYLLEEMQTFADELMDFLQKKIHEQGK